MTRALGSTLIAGILLIGGPALRTADSPGDDEQRVGESVFNELMGRAEIINASPLYDVLRPVVAPIAKAAEPRYGHPFAVYLVHEPRPNAFSVPGGKVYVTDELLYFVRNTEELAGTLCHEIAHTIGHDAMNKSCRNCFRTTRATCVASRRCVPISASIRRRSRDSRPTRRVRNRSLRQRRLQSCS